MPLAFLTVFLAYGRSLDGGFVFDDHHFVENNPSIRSLKNASRFFSDPSTQSSREDLNSDIYRPLATLSFALNLAAAGPSPSHFRGVNIFLHGCNTLLVLYLGGLLGFEWMYAALMAALFALFPTSVESFVWISGRSGVLSTALILCALICFIKSVKRGKAGHLLPLASLFTIAALFTRETAVVIPLLALAYLIAERLPVKEHLRAIGAYLALPAALFILLRFFMLGKFQQMPHPDLPVRVLAAMPFLIFAKYVDVLLSPFSMLITYTDTINARLGAFWFYFLFAIAVFLLYAALTALLRARGEKAAAFGLLWMIIALLPVLGIVSMTIYMAERLLYLPLVGFAMAVAAAARYLNEKYRSPAPVWPACGVMLVLFTINIQARLPVWKSDIALWSYDAEKNPRNFLTRLRLAEALRDAGDLSGSYSALDRALALATNDGERSVVLNEIGVLYAVRNDLEKAKRFFLDSIALNPAGYLAFFNLGKACALQRDLAAARTYLSRSLELNPAYAPARELSASLPSIPLATAKPSGLVHTKK